MEFKITKDKIARWNKMLLFWNEIKKRYSPCLVSVVHLAYFIVFVGFEVYVAAFYRRSQGWTELFRKTWTARPFSCRNSDPLLDFPLQRKEG